MRARKYAIFLRPCMQGRFSSAQLRVLAGTMAVLNRITFCLVTGASSGIGRALAISLAQEWAREGTDVLRRQVYAAAPQTRPFTLLVTVQQMHSKAAVDIIILINMVLCRVFIAYRARQTESSPKYKS